jgi:hypothetical protein
MVTGEISILIVLNIDPKHGGDVVLQQLGEGLGRCRQESRQSLAVAGVI